MKALYLLYSCIKNKKKAASCLSTWAKQCEDLILVTDESMALHLPEMVVASRGYENLCQKTCLMWEQAYERYGKEFDYFVKVDDDTYVFPENLEKKLLADRPQFFGNYSRWRSSDPSIIKWIAGSFYGLSQKSLTLMIDQLKSLEKRKEFLARGPAEDVAVSVLLSEGGIEPVEWGGIFISERKKTLRALLRSPNEIISVTNLTPTRIQALDLGYKFLKVIFGKK